VHDQIVRRGKGLFVAFVIPIIAMVFFSALYAGAYIWMRRSSFGEGTPHRAKKHH
jgi:hypothetical protein